MEFRLTYEGPLVSTQRDPVCGQSMKPQQRENKHDIRKALHPQLKRLWELTPFLNSGERSGPSVRILEQSPSSLVYNREALATRYSMFGFNFVPLVTKELSLRCGLDILFVRPDSPGDVVWHGDLDNRLKTLIDACRIPEPNEEYVNRTPAHDEKPMYCLLSDDRLITKLAVETDQLLKVNAPNEVKLIITVSLRPYDTNLGNMQFG
jgi:hypothetical protein